MSSVAKGDFFPEPVLTSSEQISTNFQFHFVSFDSCRCSNKFMRRSLDLAGFSRNGMEAFSKRMGIRMWLNYAQIDSFRPTALIANLAQNWPSQKMPRFHPKLASHVSFCIRAYKAKDGCGLKKG